MALVHGPAAARVGNGLGSAGALERRADQTKVPPQQEGSDGGGGGTEDETRTNGVEAHDEARARDRAATTMDHDDEVKHPRAAPKPPPPEPPAPVIPPQVLAVFETRLGQLESIATEKQQHAKMYREVSLELITFVEDMGFDDPFHPNFDGANPWIRRKGASRESRLSNARPSTRRASGREVNDDVGVDAPSASSSSPASKSAAPEQDDSSEARGCFGRRRRRTSKPTQQLQRL